VDVVDVEPNVNREGDGSASDAVYAWTRSRILDQTYPGGAMISEGEVSRLVGVSRTPVREAFLRLAGEDMLRLFPKRGALVVPITHDEMLDVMEARLLIEPWAGNVAAGLAGSAELAGRLAQAVEHLMSSWADRDLVAYQENDRAFHQEIVGATGNHVVDVFYRSLRDRQIRMGAAALSAIEGRPGVIIEEHRTIATAIGNGNGPVAAEAIRVHIEGTRAALALRVR
jgi:DNA-binding GntR family transcriptional regulator